jgi:hypothetical protein
VADRWSAPRDIADEHGIPKAIEIEILREVAARGPVKRTRVDVPARYERCFHEDRVAVEVEPSKAQTAQIAVQIASGR